MTILTRALEQNDWMIINGVCSPLPKELVGLTPQEALLHYCGDTQSPPKFVYSEDFNARGTEVPPPKQSDLQEAMRLLYEAQLFIMPETPVGIRINAYLQRHGYRG